MCPNKNDDMYKQTVQALGEELAHLVYVRNNNQFIDRNSDGTESELYNALVTLENNNISEVIRLKSKLYSSLFNFRGESITVEPSLTEFQKMIGKSETLFSLPKAPKKRSSLAGLAEEFSRINIEIFNEKDDDLFKASRRLRRNKIKEQINTLNNSNEPLLDLVDIANSHYEYFKNVIDNYKPELDFISNPNPISVSEIYTLRQIMDIWENIKDILPPELAEKDEVLLLFSKFNSLSKRFKITEQKAFISNTEIGIKIKRKDLTTTLEDRGIMSKFFLSSGRSANVAIQNINKLLDIAKVNTMRNNNELQENLRLISLKAKQKGIDVNEFVDFDDEGKDSFIKLISPTESFYSMERIIYDLNKKNQVPEKVSKFYKNEAIVFNIDELFDYSDINGYTPKANYEDILLDIVNKVQVGNKEFVKYIVRKAFDKQQNLLDKFHNNVMIKKQDLFSGVIDQNDYNVWFNNNNPQSFYNTTQEVKLNPYINKTYSVSIPLTAEYYNEKFIDIFNNEDKLELYNEINTALKNIVKLLPSNIRTLLANDFLPVVNKNLIREGLSYQEELKRLLELPNFSASDSIIDSQSIPLKFIAENKNDLDAQNTMKSNNFSTDLLSIISMLGQSVNHYYYFTQVKAPVLLGQSILMQATPFEKNYKGDTKTQRGVDLKHEAGQGLNNEMELLSETINHVMFLHKSKPEFNMGAYYEVEDLTELKASVMGDLVSISLNPDSVFTKDELEFEIKLITKIQEKLNKKSKQNKLGRFKSNINNFFEKLNKQYKGEEYTELEDLFNHYLGRQDKAREDRRRNKITVAEYNDINTVIYERMRELQRRTVYGSKIGDSLIRQRRSISLGLNPFSALRNYVGGYFNAIVNAGEEYDSVVFTKNMAEIVKLFVARTEENKKRAFKIYKIAKNLLVDTDLIDLQGLDEKSWFSKYGFVLMEKTEKAVRYSLMMSILEKDGLIDKFDENGNFTADVSDIENKELTNLSLKIQRVNDIVMGDTHSFKLINKNIAGRLIGQFKSSWMPEAISSRLEKESYDYKLDRVIKGRYITYADLGFTGSLIGILQGYQSMFFGSSDYIKVKNKKGNELSDTDKMNLKKNAVELSLVLGLLTLGVTLRHLADDDDDDAMLTFMINQISLIERDLTTVSPTTLTELIGGNLIPAYTVVKNIQAIIPATVNVVADDSYTLEKYMFKLSKVVPVLNIFSQFKYQSEHFVDDLN